MNPPSRRLLLVLVAAGIAIPVALAALAGETPPAGVVLVLGLIAASFVLASTLARRLLRSTSGADILEGGIPGRAVITSIRETGTTVNQNPMPEFELRVTVPGRAEYFATVTQVLPRLLLGQVEPGQTVPVRVTPDDASRVAIDWQAVAGGDAATKPAAPTVPEGLLAGTELSSTVNTQAFLRDALPASAEIDQMSETGMTTPDPETGAKCEVFAFVLTVEGSGRGPYEAKLLQGVPPAHVGKVGPGARVPIGVNPADPGDVAVDWEAFAAGSAENDA